MFKIFKKKGNVFCRRCHYLKSYKTPGGEICRAEYYHYECKHPNNVATAERHVKNWYSEKTLYILAKPESINKNNNCTWFRPKRENPNLLAWSSWDYSKQR